MTDLDLLFLKLLSQLRLSLCDDYLVMVSPTMRGGRSGDQHGTASHLGTHHGPRAPPQLKYFFELFLNYFIEFHTLKSLQLLPRQLIVIY